MSRFWLLAVMLVGACDDASEDQKVIAPPEAGAGDATEADLGDDMSTPSKDVPEADVRPMDARSGDVGRLDQGGDAGDAAVPVAACANGADDDDDGLTDYPADPGCEGPTDEDEADPETPACSNEADDDGDGNTDHPEDPGCSSSLDPSEASGCGEGPHVVQDVSALRVVEGSTEGLPAVLDACRTNEAPEAVFLFTLREPVERLHLDTAGSLFDTLLEIRRVCDDAESAVECNDDAGEGQRTSAIDLEAPALGDYYIIVDGFLDGRGPFVLNIRAELADGEACGLGAGPVGCRLGSVCREGACAPAQCADLLDNDADGLVDYPDEPGCAGPDDDDETDPDELPECADGLDNDGDGSFDFPDDAYCESAADDEEARPPQCRDGEDNDNDGLIDLEDPGCLDDPERNNEFNIEACRNGQDDDADGLIDFPFDPGCETPRDGSEADPEDLPDCSDGLDNDESGAADYPEDTVGCTYAADPKEADPCVNFEPVEITGLGEARGNTEGRPNDFNATCSQVTGPDNMLLWRVAEDRDLEELILSTRGSDFDTVLSLRGSCSGETIDCDDDSGPLQTSVLRLGPQAAGTELWIVIDGGRGDADGIWRLSATARLAEGSNCEAGARSGYECGHGLACRAQDEGPDRCEIALCSNGLDDDEDGITDWPEEPGCLTAGDDDETDPEVPPVCHNQIDDDEDGLTDFGEDPRCESAADPNEGPDCSDGRDNDDDGALDYDRDGNGFRDANADPGCSCAQDETEEPEPQCGDNCDNDRDGLIDLEDPGCLGDPERNNEFNVPQCGDGFDNDNDGNVDFPSDPGCNSARDPLEDNPDPLPECADGVDNDEDGRIDYANGAGDDGCSAAADDDERGPCDVEQAPFPEASDLFGSTRVETHDHSGSCNNGTAPDAVFVVSVPYPARVRADTFNSDFDTVLYARRSCGPAICGGVAVGDEPDVGVADAAPDAADVSVDASDASADAGDASADAGDAGLDALMSDAGDAGLDALMSDAGDDAGEDASPDAAPDQAVDAELDMGPMCELVDSELACDDDTNGVQSEIFFDWDGGDFHIFVDGFSQSSGNFALQMQATYPVGGQCGPELHAYATCEEGSRCLPDEDAGFPTCQGI